MSDSDLRADYEDVIQWLAEKTGLVFRPDQYRHTVGIIRDVMDSFDVKEISEIRPTLESHGEVLAELINQLTVGETYFFREQHHFQYIEKHILREIIARRGDSHTISAWSAGCASGEEPYSLAVVSHRMGLASKIKILATDISSDALRRAKRAVFRPWSFRGEAITKLTSYATPVGDELVLHDEIKRMVQFRELNLAAKDYPSTINGTNNVDLILCRNVLIYFSQQTVAEITERLFQSMSEGGWLITASGDPPLGKHADLEVVTNADGTFYRKPAHGVVRTSAATSQRSAAVMAHRSDVAPPAAGSWTTPASADSRVTGVTSLATVPKINGRAGSSDPRVIVATATAALESGQFDRAAELTATLEHEPQACVVQIKALASLNPDLALSKARAASERHALEEELHYLHALLLADADRTLEALQSVQKAVFLNRSSVMGHFLFGSLLAQKGEWTSASRHYHQVCELCAELDPGDIVPLSSGDTVADIATAAKSRLAQSPTTPDP